MRMKLFLLSLAVLTALVCLSSCAFSAGCEHTFGDPEIRPATCQERGLSTVVCTKCGAKETTTLSIVEHKYGQPVVTPATCTKEGASTISCEMCGSEQVTTLPITAHDYGDPVVVAATCIKEGTSTISCKNCTDKKVTTLPITAHEYGDPVVVAATCTKEGSSTISCKNCTDKKVTTLPITAHDYAQPVVVAATCTKEGSSTISCKNCTDKKVTVLSIIPHRYGYWTTTLDLHERVCECGKKESAAHTYGTDDVCTVCGARKPTATIEYVIDGATFAKDATPIAAYVPGQAFSVELPTAFDLPDGFVFGGWYDNPLRTGTAITRLTRTAAEADGSTITLYARIYRVCSDSTATGTIPIFPKDITTDEGKVPSLTQQPLEGGAVALTKVSGADAFFRVDTFNGEKAGVGVVEIKLATVAGRTIAPFGMRLRGNGANPGNFMDVSAQGKVEVLGKEIATLGETPIGFLFFFRDHASGTGFSLDVFVNGEQVAYGLYYNIPYTLATARVLYAYFGSSAAGTIRIDDLVLTNGIGYVRNTATHHVWDQGTTIVRGTCTFDGRIRYACKDCSRTREIMIPANGHQYENGKCTVCQKQETPYYVDRETFDLAMAEALSAYKGGGDNGNAVMKKASAFLYLAIQERMYPETADGRVVAHLRNLIAGGNEPYFDLEPYWNYPIMTAAIAVAKNTPSVWQHLTADEIARVDMIMKTFAVICALGTDDQNNFATGPALQGNYGKNWNPNYRLANIPQILFCKAYFGSEEELNKVLREFDYDTYMAKFEEYGFTRALARWTVTPPEDPTVNFTHPRDFMNGIQNANGEWQVVRAYMGARVDSTGRLSKEGGEPAGQGKGVRAVGEVGYRYRGYTVDQVAQIFNALLENNYGGGVVRSVYGVYPNGETDKYGSPYCSYILHKNEDGTFGYREGKLSIAEGREGMMLEFCSGDGGSGKPGSLNYRSSCSYTLHDFIMVCACLSALEELDMYDSQAEENRDIFRKMWVGNEDFLYKIGEGYMSYSLGHAYESHEGSGDGYLIWKNYWNVIYSDTFKMEDIPLYVEDTSIKTKVQFAKEQDGSNDLTLTFGAANTIVGAGVLWEQDFILDLMLRRDPAMLDAFGIRLRSSVRTDGGNRADIFTVRSDGTLTVAPAFFTPVGTSPMTINIGEYGWHHLALRYHQGVAVNEATKSVSYEVLFTIYLDGRVVGTYAGNVKEFTARGWLLYGAEYDATAAGHIKYKTATPCPGGTYNWNENSFNNPYWQFYRGGCLNDDQKLWYLQYAAQTYTATDVKPVKQIQYVLNGGSFTRNEKVKTEGGYQTEYEGYAVSYAYSADVTFTFDTPVREGYTFGGWYDNPACVGEPVQTPADIDGNTVTLYALWIS